MRTIRTIFANSLSKRMTASCVRMEGAHEQNLVIEVSNLEQLSDTIHLVDAPFD
jgi:uncharacterized lipoprotein YajG